MNINWKVRIKNKTFWLSLIPTVLVLIQLVMRTFGVELDFGKEKTHQDGTTYIPIFAQKIWAEIVPNYIAEKYGAMMPGATTQVPFN